MELEEYIVGILDWVSLRCDMIWEFFFWLFDIACNCMDCWIVLVTPEYYQVGGGNSSCYWRANCVALFTGRVVQVNLPGFVKRFLEKDFGAPSLALFLSEIFLALFCPLERNSKSSDRDSAASVETGEVSLPI